VSYALVPFFVQWQMLNRSHKILKQRYRNLVIESRSPRRTLKLEEDEENSFRKLTLPELGPGLLMVYFRVSIAFVDPDSGSL
jgi:hypothetical protein